MEKARGYDDRSVSGFEFSLRWPAEAGKGEMVEKRFIALAKSKDDAAARVRDKAPRPCLAQLVASGPSVLRWARDQGMKEGDAQEFSLETKPNQVRRSLRR